MLVGIASLDSKGEIEAILAMNGTSNSINFKAKVDGFTGFRYRDFPFTMDNTGRLCLLTNDFDLMPKSSFIDEN